MELHLLGSSQLAVTRLGIGLASLGRPGYINLGHADDLEHDYSLAAMQARAHVMLDAAYLSGIRYFDAARSYGRAEEFLGNWLRARNFPPSQIAVGSKWGYTYTAGWQVEAQAHEVKEHSLAVLQRQWHESQATLGQYLNLYQIHSATLESGVLQNVEVLTELARLKREGVLIGLTVSGPHQREVIDLALTVTVDGIRVFDCVQATWNLLETSAGAALQTAHQAGLGIIIKEALANGRLTQRNQASDFASQLALLGQAAQQLNTTVDGLALAFVLAQPWVDVVLSGAAKVEHLLSNVAALKVTIPDELMARLSGLAEPPDAYWRYRSSLAWN
jgi:aryl-alcohol dehydrogenase-like predicted oxidoreductase